MIRFQSHMEFVEELETLINKYSLENDSDTPDFLLAEYLRDCLDAYETLIQARDKWYNFKGLSKSIGTELEDQLKE